MTALHRVLFVSLCAMGLLMHSSGAVAQGIDDPAADNEDRPEVTVRLDVAGNKLILENGNCTAPDAEPGCIEATEKRFTRVRFVLVGAEGWSFRRVHVCDSEEKVSPAQCSLNRLQRLQFVATRARSDELLLPKSNGVILLTPLYEPDKDLSSFLLFNANNTKHNYFYRLEACRRDGSGRCARSDPPIINRGRGVISN